MLREWEDRLDGFAVAPPAFVAEEMQRRTESKFVMPVAAAEALIPALKDDYAVLAAGAELVATYSSLYFDTADLAFFHAHRRGRRVRYKVRIRHYPDRLVSFLEVKMRISAGVTSKARRPRIHGDDRLGPDDLRFVHTHCPLHQVLWPQASIKYRRITLISTRTAERVTIDFDLRMARRSCHGRLPDAAVVEVKQSRLDRCTTAMMALRRAGWRPGCASKYCAGIVFTSPDVRANRLLARLRALKTVGSWAT